MKLYEVTTRSVVIRFRCTQFGYGDQCCGGFRRLAIIIVRSFANHCRRAMLTDNYITFAKMLTIYLIHKMIYF
jgi:hypothetical protein